MCGIAGIATTDRLENLRGSVCRMTDAQFHRGPDDGGVTAFEGSRSLPQVCLGSRRLAILDLSAAGHQPMSNEDGSVWIVFNGEIYNFAPLRQELAALGYRFRSGTDTEVLLHGYEQWGLKALLARLNGMFAFAIWDSNSATLSLARDRLGKKPLYYWWNGKTLAFASELKALMASGLPNRRFDASAVVAYLRFGSVPAPQTMVEGVAAMLPGTVSVLANGTLKSERYWSLNFSEDQNIEDHEAEEEVLALLRDSVRIRLVSDVPVGVFLSGGIDSSAIVALAREAVGGVLRTYSIALQEPEFSEGSFAAQVALKFGSEHVEGVVTAADLHEQLQNIAWSADQPTVDGVNTYFVSKLTRDAGTVVALSGVGGDEMFGGYSTFSSIPKLLQIASVLNPFSAVAPLAGWAARRSRWSAASDRLAEFFESSRSTEAAYLAARGIFSAAGVRRLLDPGFAESTSARFNPLDCLGSAATARPEAIENQVSELELRAYLHNQLLRDTDVMSMTHSLEVRAPLLDYRLLEFVAKVPKRLKFGSRPKQLMLRALGKSLPREVTTRPKRGFALPFQRWLMGELRNDAEGILLDVDKSHMLNSHAVRELWKEFLDGRAHWSRVWSIVMLRMWQQSFALHAQ